jgi:hypothetical protein
VGEEMKKKEAMPKFGVDEVQRLKCGMEWNGDVFAGLLESGLWLLPHP